MSADFYFSESTRRVVAMAVAATFVLTIAVICWAVVTGTESNNRARIARTEACRTIGDEKVRSLCLAGRP